MVALRPEGVLRVTMATLRQEGYRHDAENVSEARVRIEHGRGCLNVVVLDAAGQPAGAVLLLYTAPLYGIGVKAQVYDRDECRKAHPDRPLEVTLASHDEIQAKE